MKRQVQEVLEEGLVSHTQRKSINELSGDSVMGALITDHFRFRDRQKKTKHLRYVSSIHISSSWSTSGFVLADSDGAFFLHVKRNAQRCSKHQGVWPLA